MLAPFWHVSTGPQTLIPSQDENGNKISIPVCSALVADDTGCCELQVCALHEMAALFVMLPCHVPRNHGTRDPCRWDISSSPPARSASPPGGSCRLLMKPRIPFTPIPQSNHAISTALIAFRFHRCVLRFMDVCSCMGWKRWSTSTSGTSTA